MASGRPTIDWTWVVERLQDADQERALKAIRVHCALRQLDGVWPVPADVVIEEGRRRLPPTAGAGACCSRGAGHGGRSGAGERRAKVAYTAEGGQAGAAARGATGDERGSRRR